MKPINGAMPVPGPTIITGISGSIGSRKKLLTRGKMSICKLKQITWQNKTNTKTLKIKQSADL